MPKKTGLRVFGNSANQLRQGILFILILLLGFVLRVYLATGSYNVDLKWFIVASELFQKNIIQFYGHLPSYIYPPLWYFVCGLLGTIAQAIGGVSFEFVERVFLSFVDLALLGGLLKLARRRGLSPLWTTALFFLNPVSIILTGHHGQFDAVPLLFVVWAIVVLENTKRRRAANQITAFVLLTTALLFKQSILFQVFTVFLAFHKNRFVGIVLTIFSVIFLGLSFVPFLPDAMTVITSTANQYAGIVGVYGVSYAATLVCGQCMFPIFGMTFWALFRNVFAAFTGLFALVARNKDIARSCLIVTLFFFTFTTGIAPQYFMYPLVFGVLYPSKWFVLFSFVTGVFLTGHWDELQYVPFQVVNYTTVWITVVLWFLAELGRMFPGIHKFYAKLKAH